GGSDRPRCGDRNCRGAADNACPWPLINEAWLACCDGDYRDSSTSSGWFEDGCTGCSPPAHSAAQPILDFGMRHPLALALILVFAVCLSAGCVPDIPVKDEFGTSALKPTGNIPPDFADFNNFDSEVNILLADQICA